MISDGFEVLAYRKGGCRRVNERAVQPASRQAMPTLPTINFFDGRRKGSISYAPADD
jgi:hypothetical protein